MTTERKISQLFNLSEENWMRHANPWSVGTRYTVLPLIVVAFWSRIWIGWWCLIPGLLSLIWMFVNPIFFKPPVSTKNWASKSVLGERVFLNRDTIPLPQHHQVALFKIINSLSFMGMVGAIYGIVDFHVWFAAGGTLLAIICKSWYLDRMVWIYEDMKQVSDTYRKWEY